MLRSVCEEVVTGLLGKASGEWRDIVSLYDKYVQRRREANTRHVVKAKILHRRTFSRFLVSSTPCMVLDNRVRGQGGIVTLPRTHRLWTREASQDAAESPLKYTLYANRQCLKNIGARYTEDGARERYLRGAWNLVEEMKQVPGPVWRREFMLVESRREGMWRTIAEKEAKGDPEKLSFPHWVSSKSTQTDFNSLPEHTRRKSVRIFTLIQLQVFTATQQQ